MVPSGIKDEFSDRPIIRGRCAIICSESNAPTSDQIQANPDERSYPSEGLAAFAGVADGRDAGAGDGGPVLAGDEP